MPFDPDAQQSSTNDIVSKDGFGSRGIVVTPDDANDLLRYAKAIQVISAGSLAFIPTRNLDTEIVTISDAPVNFVPLTTVRRVMATGTTATVIAIYD